MEEELSIDNILDSNEIENLFTDDETTGETPPPDLNEENNKETTEISPDGLFGESESVGSEESNIEEKEDPSSKKDGSSPTNFYSSIAKALKEEGVLPDLDDDTYSNVKTPEDFRDLIEQQIKASFDERQKRIDNALNYGVEPTEIKKYENTISYLESLKEEDLKEENDKGENLRKQLIYQDFINRGYSKERASREVTKSFNSGSDIEDAKESLISIKEFFQNQYDTLVNEAKVKEQEELQIRNKQAEDLKKSILEDKQFFGDLSVDKNTRQKVFDCISKPVYRDPDTGEYFTAIQKYERENKTDFLKNVGLLYTLTDGFKNINTLVKGRASKEVKKSLRELEATLSNTTRSFDGNLKFVSSVDEDSASFMNKGWSIDA